jgi:hypothetical protein
MGDGRLSVGPPPMQQIELPTPAERSILLKLVEAQYPELSPRQQIARDVAKVALGAANFERHFIAGLMFLSYVKRADRLDMERSPWWWLESCRHWLRQHAPEVSSLITPPPFLAAVVASGVQHGPIVHRTAYVELGLVAHSFLPVPICTWREPASAAGSGIAWPADGAIASVGGSVIGPPGLS